MKRASSKTNTRENRYIQKELDTIFRKNGTRKTTKTDAKLETRRRDIGRPRIRWS
jgi:hypothetical protein